MIIVHWAYEMIAVCTLYLKVLDIILSFSTLHATTAIIDVKLFKSSHGDLTILHLLHKTCWVDSALTRLDSTTDCLVDIQYMMYRQRACNF